MTPCCQHAGHDLIEGEWAAVARHLAGVRDNSAAVLHGARLLGLAPANDSQDPSPSGPGIP